MRKLMKIKLRSDLCAGVGKHYAAILDLDTALDEFGLPYIPSRRIKGCMREAADLIDVQSINELFGESGKGEAGSLRIGNAVIEHYTETVTAIRENGILHNEVTDLFCYTRQETSIDSQTGTAKDGSLRFVRVVNRDYPDSSDPICFYAPISFDDEYETEIKKICKALRNIGYHRNRGLGAIECSLTETTDIFQLDEQAFEAETDYEMRYQIFLNGDLMLPSSDSSHSMDYIPGTSVLGALAARYQGENFEDLFLSENVRFSNLYISDPEGHPFDPAPKFLAKIKAAVDVNDKGIKNTIGVKSENGDNNEPPKQYKPLKKGYINKDYGYIEPERKIVYHNNINGVDGGLYMQYCICGGQYFSGTITAKGKYLKEIYPLFGNGVIYIGRSKTAQYAACSIVDITVNKANNNTFTAKQGSVVAFVLQSDVILTDENGVFTADSFALLNTLKNDNLIFEEEDSAVTDKTAIAAKIISGYNAKWNLKKPQITAFAAGSAVIARVNADTELPKQMLIGEKRNEGFGVISVIENADSYAVKEAKTNSGEKTQCAILTLIEKRRQRDKLLYLAVKKAQDIFASGDEFLNSSQTGRILLMCKEATDAANFDKRLESIKSDSVRRIAQRHFDSETVASEVGEVEWEQIQQYLIDCLTVCKYILRKGEKAE